MSQLQFVSVHFTHDSLSQHLIHDLSFVAPAGWTGIVGRNGVGKTTVLELAVGHLRPVGGNVVAPSSGVVCHQRTDEVPSGLTELLSFPDADAGRLVSVLGIDADWPYRWESLSHGERKRAQIACALWKRPELLAVDEPTNHLDAHARDQLLDALSRYEGVGLIVSHDRELLDHLCSQCLFLDPPSLPVVRPGGVTAGLEQEERERRAAERAHNAARASHRKLEREVSRRRAEAAVQNKKRSKRNLRWKDSDAREKIDRAVISGADGQAGRLLSQLDGRLAQSQQTLSERNRPMRRRTGISVSGHRAPQSTVLYREAGTLELPDGRLIRHPDLVVLREDRIALQGPNGAGKTTLVKALLEGNSRGGEVLSIPQELSAMEATALIKRARRLDKATLGRVISTISRLASDPENFLETGRPSPGEARKLMIALGLENSPSLIVMDEPTNHLDLMSIQCLEEALGEFAGALLLVSHDRIFLRALVSKRWTITGDRIVVEEMESEPSA